MPPPVRRRTGPRTIFPDKIAKPVSITLTAAHHAKVNAAMKRLGLSRSDVLGLLVERHADSLTR